MEPNNEAVKNKQEPDPIALYKKANEAVERMFKSDYADMSISDMLGLVENEKRRKNLLAMHKDFGPLMKETPCSIKYHSPFAGGLYKHTKLVMQSGLVLWDWLEPFATHNYTEYVPVEIDKDKYRRESVKKSVTFGRDSLLTCTYGHDIGKTQGYVQNPDGTFRKDSIVQTHDIHRTLHYMGLYGIRLTHIELNAILFHGGGWTKTDYYLQPQKLSYYVHIADLIASQIMEI